MLTRRAFARAVVAGIPVSVAFGRIDSKVEGVRLGASTYSFRDMQPAAGVDKVDAVIQSLTECGVGEIELFSPTIEPTVTMPSRPPATAAANAPADPKARAERMRAMMNNPEAKKRREDLRQWRLSTPISYFQDVRKKFDDAGIRVYCYTMNYRDDFTGQEIDKTFEQANGLGVQVIACSTQLTMAQRLAPFVDKHQMVVSLHGHSSIKDPNEFATPESFAKGQAMSKYFKINLDIGHFTAANYDPVAFIKENHTAITHLHMKDRKRNDGLNMPFGEGDTPIKQVLQLLKQEQYPIPALVEYEYRGAGTPVEEVQKCMAFMKASLAA